MLREATDRDLGALRRWRNHPEVRKASFTTHEIGEREHGRWWTAVRDDPGKHVLVYEHRSVPAGVVTFAVVGDCAWWGYYLDVDALDASGELLAAWIGLERAAIAFAFGPLGLRVLRGDVLTGNDAVLRLHRRCGFTETERYVRQIDGEAREVVRLELRRSG